MIIGAAAGAATTLLVFLTSGLFRFNIRQKKQKHKELTTKAIGLLMSETNGLFTSYRLGDISFGDFERKVRELVGKLNEEVNENISILDSSYVSILARYTEDKTESLLAIREAISGHTSSALVATAPVNNTQSVQQSVPVAAAVSAPVAAGDEFSDFAASMEETAAGSDALFGGEQTIVHENTRPEVDMFSASEQTIVASSAPVQHPQAQQQFTPPVQQQPMQQQFVQPSAAPVQPVQNSMPAAAPAQQQAVGMMDVEATQEFNVSDIMNSAQSHPAPQQQNGMVSGEDVANKLDSLFG